jgi:hypothetical protein
MAERLVSVTVCRWVKCVKLPAWLWPDLSLQTLTCPSGLINGFPLSNCIDIATSYREIIPNKLDEVTKLLAFIGKVSGSALASNTDYRDIFRGFLSPFSYTPRQYFKVGHDLFLTHFYLILCKKTGTT